MGVHIFGKDVAALDEPNVFEKGVTIGSSTINAIPSVNVALKSNHVSSEHVHIIAGSNSSGMNLVVASSNSSVPVQVDFRNASQIRGSTFYAHTGIVSSALIVAPSVDSPNTNRIFSATDASISFGRDSTFTGGAAFQGGADFPESVFFGGEMMIEGAGLTLFPGTGLCYRESLSPTRKQLMHYNENLQSIVIGMDNENIHMISANRPMVVDPLTGLGQEIVVKSDIQTAPNYGMRKYEDILSLDNGGKIKIKKDVSAYRATVKSALSEFTIDLSDFDSSDDYYSCVIKFFSQSSIKDTLIITEIGRDGSTVGRSVKYCNPLKDIAPAAQETAIHVLEIFPGDTYVNVTRTHKS